MKTGTIILAAGNSSRMAGGPKQLLKFKGRSLLRGAVETALAAGRGPVMTVLGANADTVRPEISELPVVIEINENWELGVASSIKIGLAKMLTDEPDIKAVLLMLADQPLITPAIIGRLFALYEREKPNVAASEYANTVGVPAIFSRVMFDQLLALPDGHGAKSIIEYEVKTAKLAVPEAATDVDSRQDYESLLAL